MVTVVRLAVFCPSTTDTAVRSTYGGGGNCCLTKAALRCAGERLRFFRMAGDFACKRAASPMCRSVTAEVNHYASPASLAAVSIRR